MNKKDKDIILWEKVNRMLNDHVMELGGTKIIRLYKDEYVTYVIGADAIGYFFFTGSRLDIFVGLDTAEEVFTKHVLKRVVSLYC